MNQFYKVLDYTSIRSNLKTCITLSQREDPPWFLWRCQILTQVFRCFRDPNRVS